MPDISRIWRPGRLRSRAARVAGVTLLTAAAVAGTSLAPAAGAVSQPGAQCGRDGWRAARGVVHQREQLRAVGDYFSQQGGIGEALIERWNGSAWSIAA